MDIIANWLAGLPEMPKEDEFGRPWACMRRYGMTPMQALFMVEINRRERKSAPSPLPAQASAQDCPAMVYRNGVADDTHLYYMDAGKLARRDLGSINHVDDLLQLCLETGLEAIWILAGTALSDRATRTFFEAAQEWEIKNIQTTAPRIPGQKYDMWLDASQTDGQARATFLMGWKKKEFRGARVPGQDQGRAVYLGFAEHSYSYGFEGIKNPVVLLGALTYLEDAIGAPIRFSAQSTGKNLMKAENSSAARLPWIAPVNLSAFPQVATPATDLVWMRPLTAQEISEPGYLVTADKNSMYAGACTSVQLGEGAPVYKAGAEIDAGKLETGIYHIKLSGSSEFDGGQLPHPTNGVGQSWQWVYTVKLCIDLGYQVEIIEGYTWARSHTVLRPWAERVWKARAGLKTGKKRYSNETARLAACNAMQTVIRGAMGLLAHKPEFPDRPGAFDWYRPDWNALIVDHARVKMFYVIRKYADMGCIPFGVLTDCIYFIGASDDHAASLPGMFDRSTELGGYKRKVERPVTSKQIAALQARRGYTITEVNLALIKFDRGEIELEEIA